MNVALSTTELVALKEFVSQHMDYLWDYGPPDPASVPDEIETINSLQHKLGFEIMTAEWIADFMIKYDLAEEGRG